MIVDCHTHLNRYDGQHSGTSDELLKRLKAEMDQWHVEHAFILTSYKVSPERPSADEVLAAIGDDPRLHVVEGVNVTSATPTRWDEVERRLKGGRVVGLKLYPGYEHAYPTDPRFQPAIELAGRYKVPVMVHCGDTYAPRAKLKYAHPLHVDDLAVDYPDINFVICHLGNPWFMDTAEIIYKNSNAHADISGLVLEEFSAPLEAYMSEELEELLLYSGERDSLLYGTDWPLVRMGPYLRFVEKLGLEPEARAMLMGGNAARIFRLPSGERSPAGPPPTKRESPA